MSSFILRSDPVRSNPLPFSAVPHELRKDPRLRPRLKTRLVTVVAALLEYARDKAWCNPTNRTLAADCGCCPRTVQLALADLRDTGWLRIEQGPGGRVIWLTWREAPPRNDVHVPPRNGSRDPAQRAPSPPRNGLPNPGFSP
jgi:hypothetical protein